jgi:transcriptional regulator with XRE-family HTH domain
MPNRLNVRSSQPFDKDVGNTMRTHRNRIGISQDELGKVLGVTFQQIQKYEKGSNRLTLGRAVQICQVLKISLDDLAGLNGTGKRAPKAIGSIDFKMLDRLNGLDPEVKPILLNIADLIDRQVKKRK